MPLVFRAAAPGVGHDPTSNMSQAQILVVDDEKLIRWALTEHLGEAGYQIADAETGREALTRVDEGDVDLVLLDYRLPDTDGLSLLAKIKVASPDTLVILMTGYSSVEAAVEAMRQGAYDYVNKPLNLEEMQLLVEKALETTELRRAVKALRASESAPYSFDRIIGDSTAMRAAKQFLVKVARSPASTILVTGESGTGKDLVAKALHYQSDRCGGPFMNITCSALQESLLESELFGHERGAFTDAKLQKKGLLELAAGGTVFLDEIGEMTPALQAKLLRFLEEKTFKRVGGSRDIVVDVRIVAATNRDLEGAVRDGAFREDLYYRLRVLPVTLPPLRDRGGDIPKLVAYFVDVFSREFRKDVKGISPAALSYLDQYHWPGNVRELKNALERAVLLADSDVLGTDDFMMLSPRATAGDRALDLPVDGLNFEELERDLVEQALHRTDGNQTRAAALLGMSRDQIRYRMEKFSLDAPRPRRANGA